MIKRFEIFTNNIAIIHKGIQQIKAEEMKKVGLKGPHVMYLFYLFRHREGLTASQLSERVGVNKAAVSRSLSELYKNNYIDYPDYSGGKKYNTPAVLTEKGCAVTSKLNDRICELVDRISLTNVDEEHRTIMYRSLRTIANNITSYINHEKM